MAIELDAAKFDDDTQLQQLVNRIFDQRDNIRMSVLGPKEYNVAAAKYRSSEVIWT